MVEQTSTLDQTAGDDQKKSPAPGTTEVLLLPIVELTGAEEDVQNQGRPSSPPPTPPSAAAVPWSLADSWEVDLFLPELQSQSGSRRRRRRHQLALLELQADSNVGLKPEAAATTTTINVLELPVLCWPTALSAFTWEHLLQATLGTVVRHPGELMATLVRLGYEPLPGRPTTSLLTGRPILALPGLFVYLDHIRRTDGLSGLFRGLHLALLHALLYGFVYVNVHAALEEKEEEKEEEEGEDGEIETPPQEGGGEEEEEEAAAAAAAIFRSRPQFQRALLRELAARLAAGLLAAPLQVATVRCMAQLVGGETAYSSSLAGALRQVVRTSGLPGLFAGVVPSLLAELLYVAIRWSVYYGLEQIGGSSSSEAQEGGSSSSAVRRHLASKGSGGRVAVLAAANHLASSAVSPLRTVATVMAVSGCAGSLAAARLPSGGGANSSSAAAAAAYRNWLVCLVALAAAGEASRGSGSLFWRSRPLPVPPPQPLLTRLFKLLPFQQQK